jgi:hypothetical protein
VPVVRHSETLTAANGDLLGLAAFDGQTCTADVVNFHETGTWFVHGGTGHFEGMTGGGSLVADYVNGTFTLTLDGTLTRP